jgi:hypothetical protein
MDILQVMREVANKYGILNPAWLDGGWFPPSQMKVLMPMLQKWTSSGSAEDGLRYLQQKAKFIVRRGKRAIA